MLIGPNQPRPELSDQWVLEPLQNLVIEMADGGTPPRSDHENFGGGIPWVVVSDIARTIEATEETLSDIGLRRCSARIWPQGAIIVSTGATIGEVGIAAVPLATKQGITGILVDSSRLDSRFFAHCLVSGRRVLERYAQGSTFLEIRVPTLERLRLGLPARLSEQQRIAEILSTVDEAIAQAEALIAKTQQIKAGLMHDLFTRGVTADGQLRPPREETPHLYKQSPLGWIPKEWEACRVECLLSRIIDYRGKTPTKTDSGIPLITAKNVRTGFVDPEPREFIDLRDYATWMTRGIPNATDVLFTTEAPLGNVAQVGTSEPVAFAQRVIILQPKEGIRPAWLKFRLMHGDFQRGAAERATGTTALGIKQSEFRKVLVSYPPSDSEQTLIESVLESAEEQERRQLTHTEKLTAIKAGLMQELLTGRVPVAVETKAVGEVATDV